MKFPVEHWPKLRSVKQPVAWSIAGSDPSGGAGIQADLKTFAGLDVHGCSIITAITAQNSHQVDHWQPVGTDMIEAQFNSLETDYAPYAIKLGMLGNREHIECVANLLERRLKTHPNTPIIADPIMMSSSGRELMSSDAVDAYKTHILPKVTLLTPNSEEESSFDLPSNRVLRKGGHDADPDWSIDTWQDIPLYLPRLKDADARGTGCTLSSAITACLAKGYPLHDAIVVAKAVLHHSLAARRSIGAGQANLGPATLELAPESFPTIGQPAAHCFATFVPPTLPLYPIVDSIDWVKRLLEHGIGLVQIRLKNREDADRRSEIKQAIELGNQHPGNVIINDEWELALEFGAYGVHLGQDDLVTADLDALRAARMVLGLSTHSPFEIARALAYKPSYIAIGTVHQTSSKVMDYEALGAERFEQFAGWLDLPVVAIGGINSGNAQDLLSRGASCCAVISEVTQAPDLNLRLDKWRALPSPN